ncbi:carboxymuconolactone decarboxylase family protein [Ruegeria sp. EL01]|uniref:carboxymuconolactone decarboxylase family protein n=1 Tax=Ruegeria sp. EL01 TaxID=2107578 RepID=UPI000EA81DFE|nr:carboxymuconolactone decarboxylase family protein [Ruegeria sp. EL01]
MQDAYERGKALAEKHNPGLEEALEARYGSLLPGMPQDLISFVYGQHYGRPGLALRDRSLATIAALTTLGGQTAPQLRIHIAGGLKVGLTKIEIAEAIWQMSLYGGFPAAINALNVALDVFNEESESAE